MSFQTLDKNPQRKNRFIYHLRSFFNYFVIIVRQITCVSFKCYSRVSIFKILKRFQTYCQRLERKSKIWSSVNVPSDNPLVCSAKYSQCIARCSAWNKCFSEHDSAINTGLQIMLKNHRLIIADGSITFFEG